MPGDIDFREPRVTPGPTAPQQFAVDAYLMLAHAEGCGPQPVEALLDPFADPRALLDDPPVELPAAALRRLHDPHLEARAAETRRRAERLGLAVLTPDHPSWPPRLRYAPLRPLVLFVRGDLAALSGESRSIAVVGSRTPTPYGLAAAADFGRALARSGTVVWSGLAIGIDAAAHRASLEAGTPTVAVLAGGLDAIYPASHTGLAEQIVGRGGALVSEAPPGQRPRRGHFPRRNRVLAHAVEGVLVVEAGLASGSLHTARHASAAGTPVHAVPGPYTSSRSRGCHRLIDEGAMIASDPGELLRALGIESTVRHGDVAHAAHFRHSADQEAVLAQLQSGPRPQDLVRREAGLDEHRFLAALTDLLESGHVARLRGDLLARRSP